MTTPPGQPPTSGAPDEPPAPGAPHEPPVSGAPHEPPVSGAPDEPPARGAPYEPPVSGAPISPGFGYPQPGAYPPTPTTPRRRRTGLIVGIVLASVLIACGVGGAGAFLLLRNAGGEGQSTPTAAAANFLTAVYKEKDAERASKYVCSAARDTKEITKKIDEIRQYEDKFNRDPQFTWDEPKVDSTSKENAKLSVTVRFSTSDDRVAEEKLTITAVKDRGWYVCDVQTIG